MRIYDVIELENHPQGRRYHIAKIKKPHKDPEWAIFKNRRIWADGYATSGLARKALYGMEAAYFGKASKNPKKPQYVVVEKKVLDKIRDAVLG